MQYHRRLTLSFIESGKKTGAAYSPCFLAFSVLRGWGMFAAGPDSLCIHFFAECPDLFFSRGNGIGKIRRYLQVPADLCPDLVQRSAATGMDRFERHFTIFKYIAAQIGDYGRRPGIRIQPDLSLACGHPSRYPAGVEVNSFREASFALPDHDYGPLAETHNIITATTAHEP